MNQTIQQLFDRKSVRVFTDREITPDDKSLILRAACQAPTAGNQQLYTIIDVTDQALKDQLVYTCDNQPFIATAKMVLIFCADCKKWYDAFQSAGCEPRLPGVGDLALAISDTNIAAQNAVTAAESLGIGSCYIGDIMENCEQHRQLLKLPKYVFPACMLVFGYPTQQQMDRPKPVRAAMDHVVHENGYREMDGAELEAMLTKNVAPGNTYANWIHAFCKRKYNSEFSREMSRSVAQYLKDFME
ncbi:MAG: nitroreductase family protein [Oscillospiraceae bacterium]|nr:nitroreductase family protein [Oscillospiraceae bacterium]